MSACWCFCSHRVAALEAENSLLRCRNGAADGFLSPQEAKPDPQHSKGQLQSSPYGALLPRQGWVISAKGPLPSPKEPLLFPTLHQDLPWSPVLPSATTSGPVGSTSAAAASEGAADVFTTPTRLPGSTGKGVEADSAHAEAGSPESSGVRQRCAPAVLAGLIGDSIQQAGSSSRDASVSPSQRNVSVVPWSAPEIDGAFLEAGALFDTTYNFDIPQVTFGLTMPLAES